VPRPHPWSIPLAVLTTVAAALPAAAPAAAAPAPATFHLTEGAAALTAGQRAALAAHHIPAGRLLGRPTAHVSAVPAEDTDLRTACAEHQPEATAGPRGWLRSRFERCVHKHVDLIVVRDQDGEVAGEITFELWQLGWANNGVRQVDYLTSVEDITVSTIPGNVIDWPDQLIDVRLSGCTTTAEVTCADGTAKTVDQWYQVPSYAYAYTSATNTGTGPDFVYQAFVTTDLVVGTLPIRPGAVNNAAETQMRFDSGRKMSRAHGAVFPDLVPVLAFSLTDPAVNESARHIRDAQDRPYLTFPSWPGKTVPGKPGGAPLHRLVDDTLTATNRTTSIAVCKDIWGPGYTTGGLQCDEYPFASTMEGSATGTAANGGLQRFSARPVDGGDNQIAGQRLGTFLADNRVIDADSFYVRIDP
jgi:hypothetical protein